MSGLIWRLAVLLALAVGDNGLHHLPHGTFAFSHFPLDYAVNDSV